MVAKGSQKALKQTPKTFQDDQLGVLVSHGNPDQARNANETLMYPTKDFQRTPNGGHMGSQGHQRTSTTHKNI